MTLIAQVRSVVAGLLLRNRMESSMSDEMRFHVEAYTRDLIRSGVSPADCAPSRTPPVRFAREYRRRGRR